jgi:hypothetical protein
MQGLRLSLICNYIFLNYSYHLIMSATSLSSYFVYMDNDNSSKIKLTLTMSVDYLGPCFPQLPWIINALLC